MARDGFDSVVKRISSTTTAVLETLFVKAEELHKEPFYTAFTPDW